MNVDRRCWADGKPETGNRFWSLVAFIKRAETGTVDDSNAFLRTQAKTLQTVLFSLRDIAYGWMQKQRWTYLGSDGPCPSECNRDIHRESATHE
jgi:hypothetical protein